MKPTKRARKPAAARKPTVDDLKRKPGMEHASDAARYETGPSAKAAAAAPEEPLAADSPTPEADAKLKTYRLNMDLRIDQSDPQHPAPCVETDLRSYIHFLERKYGLTIHAIDYQKRPAGEHVKAVTTLGPELSGKGGNWFALAS